MYHIHAGKAIPSPNRIFYILLSEKVITDSRVKEMDIHTSILMQSKRGCRIKKKMRQPLFDIEISHNTKTGLQRARFLL